MPMVDAGFGDLSQQLLQLAQIMGRRKDQQAQNLLSLALPGQTVGDVLNPDMARRALGKGYDPNRVIKERTIDTESDRAGVAYLDAVRKDPNSLDNAPPGSILQLGATIVANKEMGMQGATTAKGIKAAQQAGQSKSEAAAVTGASVLDLVKQGTEAFKSADANTRAAIGQKLATGTTASETALSELQNKLGAETTKEAIKFAANPNTHPWGRQLRQLGIDPTAAMAAAGTGMLTLMGNIAQMTVDQAQGRIQMSVAAANREAAFAIQQDKLDDDWADRMSQAVGGKLPPSVIKAIMRGGKPPKGQETQWNAAAGLINTATDNAWKVLLADAFEKSNPRVMAMKSLIDVSKGVKDTDLAERFGVEIRSQAGQLAATQFLGPRPEPTGGETPEALKALQKNQMLWDSAAQRYGNIAPKTPNIWERWFSSKPAPVTTRPGSLGASGTKPQASINDLSPEDQQALTQFLQMLQAGGAVNPVPNGGQ